MNRRPGPLVALSALMLLLDGFQLGAFQLAASTAAAEFGLANTGMGLLVAVQYVSILLTPPLAGALADRLGKKPLMAAGVGCLLTGCLLAGLSRTLAAFAAGAFLVSAGGSVCESVSSAAITDRYPRQGGRYINLCQFFFSVGAVVGPPLLQALLDHGAPWRVFYAVTGGGFALLLPALLRLQLPRQASAPTAAIRPLSFLRAPGYRLLFAGILLYAGLETGFGYFVETLFADALAAPRMGAWAISAYWGGMAVARLICSVRAVPADRLVIGHNLAAAAALALTALCPWAAVALVLSFLVGYAYGPVWSTLIAMAAAEYPDRSAGAVGLMSAGCGLGNMVWPVLMGALADRRSIRPAFWLLAATAAAAAALALRYRRRREAAR